MSENLDTSGNPDLMVIKNLEARLEQLEKQLSQKTVSSLSVENLAMNISNREDDELELRIGQFWLPKLGIIVFIIGVIFSLTLPFEGIPAIIPSITGYVLALIILILSHFSKKSFEQLSGYFIGSSSAIAYLSTLRLYFFGNENILNNWLIELLCLLFIVSITLWYAVKNRSPYLASLGIFLGYFTLLTIVQPNVLFLAILALSSISVYIFLKNGWQNLLIFAIILAYLSHLVWFVSNPFVANTFDILKQSDANLFFILGYASIFSIGILYRKDNSSEELPDIISSLLNSATGYGIFLIITLLNTSAYFGIFHLLAATLFLSIATFFWIKEKSQYSTFIYAMTGYAALSVAIIFQFDKPWNLILLCWQSLLVLSTAVWFKSKFIIVANSIIFLIVLVSYLASYRVTGIEAISFGLVALLSARILNWQRERLELQTGLIRNLNLIIALAWIPYVFYCVLPSVYVGISLLALALVYFGMSKLIKNMKYRWMAVMTLLITVCYLMIFGITNPDITYKIVSFLLAGIVLIITSAAYSRIRSKSVNKI